MKLGLISLSLVCLVACVPHPVNPPPDADATAPPITDADAPPAVLDADSDADDGKVDLCAGACANLRKIGCSAGYGVDGGDSCEFTCRHSTGTFDLKPRCLVMASTKADAVACGTIRCK